MPWLIFGGVVLLLLLGESTQEQPKNTLPPGKNKVLRWKQFVEASCARWGVPRGVVYATIEHESGGNPNARSNFNRPPWHAYGLMQLLPDTARANGLAFENIFDGPKNIEAGTRFIAGLLKKYNGDVERVFAHYFGGGGAAKRPFRTDIQKYVNRSVERMKVYQNA